MLMQRLRAATVFALVCAMMASPPASLGAEPYIINAILPLSGSGAFLGKEEREALEVVQARVNATGGIGGRQIQFVVADDQSRPQTAVQLASEIVSKHVPVILGSALTALCNAIIPLAKDGPVLYCFSPGIRPASGSFVFSSSFSTRDLVDASVRYLRLHGLKKIALVTSTDTSGQEAERSVDEALASAENSSVQLVDREHFSPTDISATAQMARVKGSGAQAVIAWSTGTPVGTLLRAVRDVGLNIPVVTSNGNLTYEQMKEYAGFLPPELIFPAGPSFAPNEIRDRRTREIVNAYLGLFTAQGLKPDNGNSLAWDPTQLVVEGLRKIGPGATAQQLRAYLNGVTSWVGINGPYNFRAHPQRGLAQGSVVMVRWDDAKQTWVGISKPGGAPL